jgi:asparagine synthase (glutamine-hydrolysing)
MNVAQARPGSPLVHRDLRSDSFFGWVNLRDSGDPAVIRSHHETRRQAGDPLMLQGPEGWVAFLGRLDARADLARTLGVQNEPATPDVELVRLAFAKWQENAPQHLLGDFAIAAWHEREKRLWLAADVTGINTVYTWRTGDRLYFATSLRDLLRESPAPIDLSEAYIADCLAMNLADDDATPYRHIHKVAAGTCVATTEGSQKVVRYHQFNLERRIRLANENEYVEAAWELLQQAVRDRTRGLDTVHIMGSSGLDSAAVAAATAAVRSEPFAYITAIPDLALPTIPLRPNQQNEQHLVEVMAAAFPLMRPTFVAPAADQNWDPGWPEYLQANYAPHRSSSHVAWFHHACRTAAQLGAHTFLGGGGGNMTLTWDGWRRLPRLFLRGHCGEVTRELLQACGGSPRRFAGLTWRELIRPLLGPRYDYRSLERYAALRPQAVDDLGVLHRMQATGNDPSFVRSLDHRVWRLQALLRGRARRTELTNMHRSLYGLTHSMPLLDQRLVEFCLAIPEDQYLRNGNFRWLARRLLLAAGVPPAVAENRSFGYQHPEWFAHLTESRPAMRDQIARLRSSPLASRLIDTDRLERLLDAWPKNPIAAERLRIELGSVLAGGVAVGAFVHWAETGLRARSAAAGQIRD